MPCTDPIPAHLEVRRGKRELRLHSKTPTHWIDCKKCLGCRDKHTRQWGARLAHEMRSHTHNTFLTLTYDDENQPLGLQPRDLELFWKRLRERTQATIKYFACGEYGNRTQRAHYHAAVYGLPPFDDTKRWDSTNNHSEKLDIIWGNGRILSSNLTRGRCNYVAGYVLKKAGYRKQLYCDHDGVELQPPFQRISQGLGKHWLTQYADDLRHGTIKQEGKDIPIPRQYKIWLEQFNRKDLIEVIQAKNDEHRASLPEPDPARLRAARAIREQQLREHNRKKVL